MGKTQAAQKSALVPHEKYRCQRIAGPVRIAVRRASITAERHATGGWNERRNDIGGQDRRAAARRPLHLLQVAASALHLLDLALDDELRPLARAGLNAIRQAANGIPAMRSAPTLNMRISR